jgi:hypothetical protein
MEKYTFLADPLVLNINKNKSSISNHKMRHMRYVIRSHYVSIEAVNCAGFLLL